MVTGTWWMLGVLGSEKVASRNRIICDTGFLFPETVCLGWWRRTDKFTLFTPTKCLPEPGTGWNGRQR